MTTRIVTAALTAIVVTAGVSAGLGAQKPAPTPFPAAVAKTSWGDPDLQGTWSGDSAFAIPMQRPEALGTKAELTDQEYADKLARDEQSRNRASGAVGPFRNDGAWLDKSFRQTSLIVEPANGRLPPLTPEAERLRAAAPRGTYGNGPLDSPEDFTLYDRCISLGAVGSMTPKIYGNGYRIIPLDGRPHAGRRFSRTWGTRAAIGKAARSSSRRRT